MYSEKPNKRRNFILAVSLPGGLEQPEDSRHYLYLKQECCFCEIKYHTFKGQTQ